jgi:hypothetical protein
MKQVILFFLLIALILNFYADRESIAQEAATCQYNSSSIIILPGKSAPLQCDKNGNLLGVSE